MTLFEMGEDRRVMQTDHARTRLEELPRKNEAQHVTTYFERTYTCTLLCCEEQC